MIKTALRTVAQIGTHDIRTCIIPSDTVAAIKKVTAPVFFITCKNDDKAPVDAVRAIYDHKPGFKRLWITNGRMHFDSFFYNPEKYAYKVHQWIEKFLNGDFKNKVQEKIVQDPLEL